MNTTLFERLLPALRHSKRKAKFSANEPNTLPRNRKEAQHRDFPFQLNFKFNFYHRRHSPIAFVLLLILRLTYRQCASNHSDEQLKCFV